MRQMRDQLGGAIHVRVLAAGLAVGLSAMSSNAQVPALVKNINVVATSNAGSGPSTPVRQGTRAFFAANDGINGTELWVTDGTAANTFMVKDINPGSGNGSPTNIVAIGTNQVLFAANDGTSGTELWISDGTDAGTVRVLDIQSGSGSSSPGSLTQLDANTIIFTANNGSSANGTEIWRSDGTAAGTFVIKDIEPGTSSSSPFGLTSFNGAVYFRATASTNGGTELYRTDGTLIGTIRVADINPSGNSSPDAFTVGSISGSPGLYFSATDGSSGTELYKYDGVSVTRVKDINSGSASGLSSPLMVAIGDTLFFSATNGSSGRELWKTDGTEANTEQVIDLNPGSGDGIGSDSSVARIAVNRSGQLLFAGTDGVNGTELWTSDGTALGTTIVKDVNPGSASSSPTNMRVSGGKLYFSGIEASVGQELFVSDGTPGGTGLIVDLRTGPSNGSPLALSDFNGQLLFSLDSTLYGRELFLSDGTAVGTMLVKDIRTPNTSGAAISSDLTSSTTRAIGSVARKLYFRASDGITGDELYVSNSTTGGTSRVADIRPGVDSSSPAGITDVNGRLFFTANDGTTGQELWSLDSGGMPYRVKDIRTGTAAGVLLGANLINLNGTAIFVANDSTGDELWKSDGTDMGTAKIADINSTAGISASSPIVFDGKVYLAATGDAAQGSELWSTDGNAVTLAADIPNTGTTGSAPSNFLVFQGKLYFAATGSISGTTAGNELWSYDAGTGTAAIVKDIRTGTASSSPRNLVALGNKFYFSATDGTSGIELYSSDGAAANTIRVADIASGSGDGLTTTTPLVRSGNLLFFAATGSTGGTELWVHNPTAGTTTTLAPTAGGIHPTSSSSPVSLTDVNGTLYFAATDGTNGVELWKSNGTNAGTQMVADINPGSASSTPRNLRLVNDGSFARLYFSADNGVDGEELYVLSVCRLDVTGDQVATIDDIFVFLNIWFAQSPGADFDGSGMITIDDIFIYINAWFAGC
jgi:ELWxxDGT repeat protein